MPDARLQRTREAYRTTATDRETGIAIRYIQAFDATAALWPTLADAAMWRLFQEFARDREVCEPSDDDLWGV